MPKGRGRGRGRGKSTSTAYYPQARESSLALASEEETESWNGGRRGSSRGSESRDGLQQASSSSLLDFAGLFDEPRRSGRQRKQVVVSGTAAATDDQEEEDYSEEAPVYDAQGRTMVKDQLTDLCDCLKTACPGCHWECPECASRKCGHVCRQSRAYAYDFVATDGEVLKRSFPTQL